MFANTVSFCKQALQVAEHRQVMTSIKLQAHCKMSMRCQVQDVLAAGGDTLLMWHASGVLCDLTLS